MLKVANSVINASQITGTLPVANGGTGVTTSTGTTNVVLSNSPTLVTPNLGTPTTLVLTSATGLPLTTGVTGTLPVANGGTGDTGTAWTSYTPTLAVDTGTITTSIINARYIQLGKTIFISLSISFTVTSGSPTEFRVSFPSSQVAPNNNQYTPVYMNFNSTAILGLARATVNSYGLQITPSNGLTYVGNCGFFVNTVFELN